MPKSPGGDNKGLLLPLVGILLTLSAVLTPLIPASFGGAVNLWAGIGQLILAAVTFLIDIRRRKVAEQARLDPSSRALARVVGEAGNAEARRRGLKFPLPLQLRWHGMGGGEAGGYLDATDQRRPLAASLVRMFQGLAGRRLLVLGEQGSGKSTLAMLFTLAALRDVVRPDADTVNAAVPVLIPLESWRPSEEPLRDFIVRRLPVDYPAVLNEPDLGPDAILALVTDGRVLPVLDGLDETPQPLRAKAIEKLNDYSGPVLVTCQREAYAAATAGAEALAVDQVILIDAIQPEDVAVYLDAGGAAEARRWAPVVSAIAADPRGPLAVAFSTPLIVSLARAVYRDSASDPAELCRLGTSELIENHLFERLLTPSAAAGGPPARERPLSILAYYLEPDLAWWELAVAVPPLVVTTMITVVAALLGVAAGAFLPIFGGDTVHSVLYGLIAGAAAGVVTGGTAAQSVRRRMGPHARLPGVRVVASALRDSLVAMAIVGAALLAAQGRTLTRSDVPGLAVAVTFAGLGGLCIGLIARGLGAGRGLMPSRTTVNPAELVPWLVRGMLVAGLVGLPFGVLVGIVAGIQYGGANGVSTAISAAVLVCVGAGIPVGVGRWLGAPPAESDIPSPRAMLKADREALLLAASASAGAVGVAAAMLATVLNAQAIDAVSLDRPLWVGVACGLVAFGVVLCGSGSPWFSYVVARLWFAAVRRQLPWNLLGFLDDAAKADIMRSTGSVYQFRHARLRRFLTARFVERVRPSAWLVRRPEVVAAPRRRPARSVVRAATAGLAALVLLAGIGVATVPQLRTFIDRRDTRVDDERARALIRAADAVQDDDRDHAVRLRLAAAAVDPDPGSLADLTAFLRVRQAAPIAWTRSNRVVTAGHWAVALNPQGTVLGWDLALARPSTVVVAREAQDIEAAGPGRLEVVGLDGRARILDLTGPAPGTPIDIGADTDSVESLGVGGWIVVTRQGGVTAWNLSAGVPAAVTLAHNASMHAVLESTGWVVVVEDGAATAWHADGASLKPVSLGKGVNGVRIREHTIVEMEGGDGAVASQWDLTSGPAIAVDVWALLSEHPRRPYSSADGRWIVASGSTGGAVAWSAVSSKPQRIELATNATGGGEVVGAGPGSWFVMRTGDATATLWNLAADPPSSYQLPQSVQALIPGPDPWTVFENGGLTAVSLASEPGERIAAGPPGSTVDVQGTWLVVHEPGGGTRAWNTATTPLSVVSLDGAAAVRFSMDGRWAVVTAGSETVENMTGVWDVAQLSTPLPADPVAYACQAVGHGLSEAEWKHYAPTTPYRQTCAD